MRGKRGAADDRPARLEGVWKRYSRSGGWVLRDVGLVVEPGRVHLVTAGNGRGKSTLLRLVAGASTPTRGTVTRPAGVAYVPEQLPVSLRMTARSYLAHMARLRGLDPAAARRRTGEVLESLALDPGADVPIGRLSKGNRQKVGLAQALAGPVRLLVLDEPLAGLDQPAAQALRGLVAEAAGAGAAVLVSAHRPDALPADRVHELVDGRLGEAPSGVHTHLVLRPAAPDPLAAHRLPGVRSSSPDPDSGLTRLLTDDADATLRSALSAGWSFVQGGPGGDE